MDKVIVTGSSGFIGRYVVQALRLAGFQVVGVDLKSAPEGFEPDEFVRAGIDDSAVLESHTQGCRFVYHFAGIADIEDCNKDPISALDVNVLGTARLLECAAAAGIERFFFASSAYASSRMGGVYRTTKLACESLLKDYWRRKGLAFTSLRFGTVYGPGSDPRNSVHRFIREALEKQTLTYHGSGQETREYIYVVDAARLCLELQGQKFQNRTVLVTGNFPTKVTDVFAMIQDVLGTPIDVRLDAGGELKAAHYKVTPFSFEEENIFRKNLSEYIDLGQGILNVAKSISKGS